MTRRPHHPCLPAGRDHRFGVKVHNIEKVLDGDLDALLKKIGKQ